MKSLFYFIGVLVTLLFFLGLFDILDFRICIKPKGECQMTQQTFKQKIPELVNKLKSDYSNYTFEDFKAKP